METIITFFENLSTLQKFVWLVCCLSLFWLLEGIYPLKKHQYNKWKHAKTNFILLLSTLLINLIFGLITVGVFIWLDETNFGLLNQIELPIWAEAIIAILILDFTSQYLVHYILHKTPVLWRFHTVHHSDTQVDVTSGTRHHPIDFIFRETFALLGIVIAGLPVAYYLMYRMLTVIFTYFSHADIKLPNQLDKIISYLFVSPNMHKFHHHHVMPWTDTNFGNIFSIWDRLFGTFIYQDTKNIVYGVDILESEKTNDLLYQLKAPFKKDLKSAPYKG